MVNEIIFCTVDKVAFFLLGISIYILSIVFHEVGHFLSMFQYEKGTKIIFHKEDNKFKLQTGYEHQYKNLNNSQKAIIYIGGIGCGLIPIAIAGAYNNGFFVILAPYILGSIGDIKKLWRVSKG